MNIIKIIITILLVLILIVLLYKSIRLNSKQSGSSAKIEYDIANKLALEQSSLYSRNVMYELDIKHDNFLTYLCEYISNSQISSISKMLIVGDVHGSILQLFMPLKQAGILKELKIDPQNKEFTFSLNSNISNVAQVIYCGDFVGRAKHTLTIEMLLVFIKIYNKVNNISKNKIIWVFGNHDVSFIRGVLLGGSRISDIENCEEIDIINDKNIDILKNKMLKILKNNEYPCMYYSDSTTDSTRTTIKHSTTDSIIDSKTRMNIQVSHTFISETEYYISSNNFLKTNHVRGLAMLYDAFNDDMGRFEKLFNSFINCRFDEFNELLIEIWDDYSLIDNDSSDNLKIPLINQFFGNIQKSTSKMKKYQNKTNLKLLDLFFSNKLYVYSPDTFTINSNLDKWKLQLSRYSEKDIPKYLINIDDNTPENNIKLRNKFVQDDIKNMKLMIEDLEKHNKPLTGNEIIIKRLINASTNTSNRFQNLKQMDKLKFINNFAKYFVFLNIFPYQVDLEKELYQLRPYTTNKKPIIFAFNNKYFKMNSDVEYFIGHTTMFINGGVDYETLIKNNESEYNKYINKEDLINDLNISEHKKYLQSMLYSSKLKDEMAKYLFELNFKNALMIKRINDENIFSNFFNNAAATYKQRTAILEDELKINDPKLHMMDVGATFPITAIGDMIKNRKLNEYMNKSNLEMLMKEDEDIIKNLPTVEIGFNTCCYAIVTDSEIKPSKVYLF